MTIDSNQGIPYTVPTDFPESDGALQWNSTTLVLVHAHGGNRVGLGLHLCRYGDRDPYSGHIVQNGGRPQCHVAGGELECDVGTHSKLGQPWNCFHDDLCGRSTDTPMVVLEPSCCSVFRDELHNLFPESSEAKWLAENTFTLSEFMEKTIPGYQPPKVRRQAIVQGHCHHKAVMRMKEEKSLMEKMQLDNRVLESGCGMAGASATKRTNIRFRSRAGSAHSCLKCGRLQFRQLLWPTVLAAKKRLPRRQTVMRCILAEVLRLGLGDEEKPLPAMYPESYFVQPRKDAQKKSMVRAAVISGLALATLSLMWLKSRKR